MAAVVVLGGGCGAEFSELPGAVKLEPVPAPPEVEPCEVVVVVVSLPEGTPAHAPKALGALGELESGLQVGERVVGTFSLARLLGRIHYVINYEQDDPPPFPPAREATAQYALLVEATVWGDGMSAYEVLVSPKRRQTRMLVKFRDDAISNPVWLHQKLNELAGGMPYGYSIAFSENPRCDLDTGHFETLVKAAEGIHMDGDTLKVGD